MMMNRFIEVVLNSNTCANITVEMGKGGISDFGTGVNDTAVYEKWLQEKNPDRGDFGRLVPLCHLSARCSVV